MMHSAGVESGTFSAIEKHKWTYTEPQDIKIFALMIQLKYERDSVKRVNPSLIGSQLNNQRSLIEDIHTPKTMGDRAKSFHFENT
jgi:hypothetical protein